MPAPVTWWVTLIGRLVTDLTVTQMLDDPLAAREPIPVGATYASGLVNVVGEDADSNTTREVVVATVTILHHLSDPHNENIYKTTTMLDDQRVLMSRAFWRSVNGTNDVLSIDLDEPERVGNIIRWTVLARIVLESD